MHRLVEAVFGPQGLAVSDGPRIYELTGHLGALGVVALVMAILLWIMVMAALALVIIRLARRERPVQAWPPALATASDAAPRGEAPDPGAARIGSEALRLLDERYARGELGRDEYLERRADLSGV